ncbi:MAG: flavodoxin domain-containing protein [bacterium]|jgi:menaquinone-dependent protoporphyrinogen oxidase|nr:flavodoxin domain-containing protein [candidate division KSB1 bacterium]MDH7561675.1 flavodoxin domain-containing protein [bacterium]
MRVLVTYGSKYGATKEIAEKIGQVLRDAGVQAEVRAAGEAGDLSSFGAAVIGSAVYAGQWRKEAAAFVRKYERELSALPVWIFSSGPLGKGDPVTLLRGWRIPKALQAAVQQVAPRDIAVFHGALDESKLNRLERTILRLMKAQVGDFRDWEAIAAWAKSIAAALKGK